MRSDLLLSVRVGAGVVAMICSTDLRSAIQARLGLSTLYVKSPWAQSQRLKNVAPALHEAHCCIFLVQAQRIAFYF